jgi:23S rRNA (cytidine1920-2'-O)/16S rRNA (cytidine1409-2'-O)-methyltransferase
LRLCAHNQRAHARRADQRLVELGLVPSRARAQAEIRAGTVICNGRVIARASTEVACDALLELHHTGNLFVSRGGLKLDAALEHFGIEATGKVALDVGASTGGFTDVLLARGASRVYAIDVGHDQLHEKLCADPRVISREGINARDLDASLVPEAVDLIVVDVSFISLKLALPSALALAKPDAVLIALVKPQFEAGRGAAKKGIVRDPEVHNRVCAEIQDWVGAQGWHVLGLVASPISGGDGNREFLLAARRQPA